MTQTPIATEATSSDLTKITTVSPIDTLTLHIRSILSNDASWRAMAMDGTEGAWITIHKPELDLWVAAGVERDIFEKQEHVFKVEDQPTVQVVKEGKFYRFNRININGKFYNNVEWKASLVGIATSKAATPAKPATPAILTIKTIDAQIDKLIAARTEQRKATRDEMKVIFTPEDQAREKAEIINEVVSHIDTLMDNYGKAQLRALWRSRRDGDFRKLPNQPQTIVESLKNQQLRSRDYTLSLAKVIDLIFPDVAALEGKKPFLHPVTNEPITVDWLILADGLINKMTKSVDYWTKLVSLDDKRVFMGALVTKTQRELEALRLAGSKVTNVEHRIKITFEAIPGDPKHKRLVAIVDKIQQIAIEKALKALIEDVKQ